MSNRKQGPQQKTLRPPVKWHGGKRYLCHRIIEHFPPHRTYLEPFGGAASVLLNKPPSDVEVYNDLDERITRLFRVLRENGEELQRRRGATPPNMTDRVCHWLCQCCFQRC
ncbi:MAG: DNA adenine methylase, partial [Planctomycetota bacterium]|nr:DNA adenine methylase [Planctomycetota bacterium]